MAACDDPLDVVFLHQFLDLEDEVWAKGDCAAPDVKSLMEFHRIWPSVPPVELVGACQSSVEVGQPVAGVV